MKKIAIQQPEHFPWIGFFNKMLQVDEFILLDNVQLKKRYFENRNKIIFSNKKKGWSWITVPVITKGRYTQNIREVKIDTTQKWKRKYINSIKMNYSKSKFFDEIFNVVQGIINNDYKKLLDLNLDLIEFVRNYLGIKTKTILASKIWDGKGSDLILNLCKKRNADIYLSGPDGRNYLQLDKFEKEGIEVEYHDYVHPEYKQNISNFISHLSVLDLLFNYGKTSIDIIGFNIKEKLIK